MTAMQSIENGDTALGIEILDSGFRCLLIDHDNSVIARAEGPTLPSCYDSLCSSLGTRPAAIGAIAICGPDIPKTEFLHFSLTGRKDCTKLRCSANAGSLLAQSVGLIDSTGTLAAGTTFAAPKTCDICAMVASNLAKPYERGTVRTADGTYSVRIFDNEGEFQPSSDETARTTPEGYISLWKRTGDSDKNCADTCYGAALLASYYNWSNNSEDLREYLSTYVFSR